MGEPPRIRVLLLADGHVRVPEGELLPGVAEATWEVLGQIRLDGEPMAFVRADMAGVTWTALVRSPGLETDNGSPVVTLTRQSEPHPPLSGWALFC
jgi:hypothetical protein